MSHNTMSTWFSTTDTEELQENVGNHNGYLSLIVNNKNEMCAKFAVEGKEEVESKTNFLYKTLAGVFKSKPSEKKIENNLCVTIDLNIIKESTEESIEEFFVKRYEEIEARDKIVTVPKRIGYTPPVNNDERFYSNRLMISDFEDDGMNYMDKWEDVPTTGVKNNYNEVKTITFIMNCLIDDSYKYEKTPLGLGRAIKHANDFYKEIKKQEGIVQMGFGIESQVVDAIDIEFPVFNMKFQYQIDKIVDLMVDSLPYLNAYRGYTCISSLVELYQRCIDTKLQYIETYFIGTGLKK